MPKLALSIPRRFRPPRLTRAKPAFRNGTSGARRGIKRSLAVNGAALAANQAPKGLAIGLASLPFVGPAGAAAIGAAATPVTAPVGWAISGALGLRLNRRRKISTYLDRRAKRTRGVYKSAGAAHMSQARILIAKAQERIEKAARGPARAPRSSVMPYGSRHQYGRAQFFAARAKRNGVKLTPRQKKVMGYLAGRYRGSVKGPRGTVRREFYKALIEKASRPTTRTLPRRFVQGGTRGRAGALRIEGNTLYSYARPIAQRKVGRSGKAFVHYAGEGRSSVTTARHISAARAAGMIGGPKQRPSGKRTHASTQSAIARRLRQSGLYSGGSSYNVNARINARRSVRKAFAEIADSIRKAGMIRGGSSAALRRTRGANRRAASLVTGLTRRGARNPDGLSARLGDALAERLSPRTERRARAAAYLTSRRPGGGRSKGKGYRASSIYKSTPRRSPFTTRGLSFRSMPRVRRAPALSAQFRQARRLGLPTRPMRPRSNGLRVRKVRAD